VAIDGTALNFSLQVSTDTPDGGAGRSW